MATSLPRILIVEDDRSTRNALAKLMEISGFAVTTASSLGTARAKLNGQGIVLLDLILPDGNGEELVRLLRLRRHPAKIAVISATLDPSPHARFHWTHPPDAWFAKPLDVDRLLAWLHSPSPRGAAAKLA